MQVDRTTPFAPATFYPTDVILASCDGIYFSVHKRTLLAASSNNFGGRLSQHEKFGAMIPLHESASIINLALHSIYTRPCATCSNSFSEVSAAVAFLESCGIPPAPALATDAPLGQALLEIAPRSPLDVYTLAAAHDSHDLAIAASAHLLSFPLWTLTDQTAARIGGPYVKKLYNLHLDRIAAFRKLLVHPPAVHPPTARCNFVEQKKLAQAWAFTAATMGCEVKAGQSAGFAWTIISLTSHHTLNVDTSIDTVTSKFSELRTALYCPECRAMLADRVQYVVTNWSIVKVSPTILTAFSATDRSMDIAQNTI
jgi:hypothetical protein